MAACPRLLASALAAAALAGCAAMEPGYTPPGGKRSPLAASVPVSGQLADDGRYVLSESEQKLDCRKLAGIIHVGILQTRDSEARHRPSVVAKAARAVASPVAPGSAYGMDPDADYRRAVARLNAFNARLEEKDCPLVYNLEAELAPGNTAPPAPIRRVKRGKKREA